MGRGGWLVFALPADKSPSLRPPIVDCQRELAQRIQGDHCFKEPRLIGRTH